MERPRDGDLEHRLSSHRQGKTKAEIKGVTAEKNVDVVILGQPSGTLGQNFFAAKALKNFAAEIEAETEAQVVLV